MSKFNRRQFLKSSLISAASLNVLPAFAAEEKKKTSAPSIGVQGANSDIRYAVVGFNGRGKDHLKEMGEQEGVRLVALCDVDSKVLGREVSRCNERGQKIEGYTDIRKLLENKDIDVVTFATPNHWHALGAIWAIQAGKDVYLEKPVCHNVWEGRKIVEAARKHGKIVQTGTQSRSSHGIARASRGCTKEILAKFFARAGFVTSAAPALGKWMARNRCQRKSTTICGADPRRRNR